MSECKCFAPLEGCRRWCRKCDLPIPTGPARFTEEEIARVKEVAAHHDEDDPDGNFWQRIADKMEGR